MKIKQLDIAGFKSFCDQTKIVFNNSVTSVVGPNGCGKSNIVDAIRWALGEQSAKNLRGRAMDDVIFNGSESRAQQSVAEVTITFDNTDGLSDPSYVDFTEVAVTRRLHRDGTSEYLINQIPCRLKDITDLFLGTGGGARAYSIIEQGRIGLIVSSRSEDRRGMIEEAAGITKYKAARRTAERKMERTRQNLLRINDITTEMERNLASLKRQAKKAERYKKYRDEQTDLDLYVSAHKYLELRAESMVIAGALHHKDAELASAKDELDTLEARIAARRLDEQTTKSELDEKTAQGYEINKEIQVIENEVGHLVEAVTRYLQAERNSKEQEVLARNQLSEMDDESSLLKDQIEKIVKDSSGAKNRYEELALRAAEAKLHLDELAEAHNEDRDQVSRSRARQAAAEAAIRNFTLRMEETKSRLANAQNDRKSLEGRAKELQDLASQLEKRACFVEKQLEEFRVTEEKEQERFDQLGLEVDQTDQERLALRDDLQAKISRRASLQEVMDGLESHDHAVREAVELVEREGGGLLQGLLIDYIECPEQYEKALAAVLNDRLQALVVKDRKSGLKLLELLRERDMGQVNILAKKGLDGAREEEINITDSSLIGQLSEFIEVDEDAREFTDRLLSGVYIAKDIKRAEKLWHDHKSKAAFVTLDGQLLEANGVMRGGRGASAEAHLLGQKRHIRELGAAIDSVSKKRDELDERFEALKDELNLRREAGESARLEAQTQEIAIAEIRKDRARVFDDLERLGAQFETADREVAHQKEMLAQAKEDLAQANKEQADTASEIEKLEEALARREVEIEACRDEADKLSEGVSDLRVEQAALEQQLENADRRIKQIANLRVETDVSLEKMAEKRISDAAEMGRAAGKAFRQREVLIAKLEETELVQEEISVLRGEVEAKAALVVEAEASRKTKRSSLDAISEEISDLKMKNQEINLELEHLLESVNERNHCNLLSVLGDYHLRPIPGEEVRSRIDDLNRLIDRMGPINLAAIDEYESESVRYSDLIKQRDDLEQALEDLERAIARMDRDSRRRFKETFEDVNRRFKVLFPRLFKGGQAELSLTDPSDMLTTGVDISAQPPGKRLGNVELLSGGEKALTAVALLFAIFLHRPSPFCILDEVDAPLDEANVDRFIDVVHQMTDRSQFIIITHSKLTMERSDALYGVTMEEAGVSKMVSVRFNALKEAMAANS